MAFHGLEILVLITLPPPLGVTPRPSALASVGGRQAVASKRRQGASGRARIAKVFLKTSGIHFVQISANTTTLSDFIFFCVNMFFFLFFFFFFLKMDFVKLEVMAFCRFLRGQTGTYLECLGFRFLWVSVVGTRSRIQLCRYRHNVPPEIRSRFLKRAATLHWRTRFAVF